MLNRKCEQRMAHMKFKPTVTTCAGAALLILACWPIISSAGPSAFPELDRQVAIVEGLTNTRAVVIAKLVKRRQSADEAYLVFERQQVARGDHLQKLFAVRHPEEIKFTCGAEYFHIITQEEIDALQEGGEFLIILGQGDLLKWIPLSSGDRKKLIEAELKPYEALDACRKLDPWKAAQDPDPFVVASARARYSFRTTLDECAAVLQHYAESEPDPGWSRLGDLVVERLENHFATLPANQVLSIYRRQTADARIVQPGRRRIALQTLRLSDDQPSAELDQLILQLLEDAEPEARLTACLLLMRRKIPAAVPKLKSDFPTDGMACHWAARALVFQDRGEGVKEIIAHCVKSPHPEEFYGVLRDHVSIEDVEAINRLGANQKWTQSLLAAAYYNHPRETVGKLRGDSAELAEVCESRWGRDPAKWNAAARLELQDQKVQSGSDFCLAAETLLQGADPNLSDLILPYIYRPHYHKYALRYLVPVAKEKHRPVLQDLDSGDPEQRIYAVAGLARLGDHGAFIRMIRMAMLPPDSKTRFQAWYHVLGRFKKADLIAHWKAERPTNDATAEAVYQFVLTELESQLPLKANWMY